MTELLAFLAAFYKKFIEPHLPTIKRVALGWFARDYVSTKQELKEVIKADEVRQKARAVPDNERIEWLRKRGLLREVQTDTSKPD